MKGPHRPCPRRSRASYRIGQERLTNAVKHAPGSVICTVLGSRQGWVDFSIESGPPTRKSPVLGGGTGLESLCARVHRLDGHLRAERTAGRGFALQGRIPLSAADAAG